MARDKRPHGGAPHRRLAIQRGFGGFLIMVLIAGLAATAGLFTFYRADDVKTVNERATADALAAAKAALIAYAVRRGGATGMARPGELPCPDTDGDGVENAPCILAPSLFGRLPWKTLGIPELRDGAGEPLWYALSGPFRDALSNPLVNVGAPLKPAAGERINSDTRGTLVVRASDDSTLLTNEAAAVIFAPGAPIGGQSRGLGSVACALFNLAMSPRLCVTNYLESATGIGNLASLNGPFTVPAPSTGSNDRLIYLTSSELIPAVEMRVGNELKSLLEKYRAATESSCKCYPWADTWDYSGGIADVGQNRGRFPSEPFPYKWGTNGIAALPDWVADNDWHNLFWYSVSRQNTDGGGAKCKTCSDAVMLTVDGMPVSALFIMPGTPADGLARLTNSQRRDKIDLYFEDAANRDGANESLCKDTGEIGGGSVSGTFKGALTCDQYAFPTEKRHNRDRMLMAGVAGPGVCVPGAKALVDAVPCGWPTLSSTCQSALKALDSCTCLDAARTLTKAPCTTPASTLPSSCAAAVTKLEGCKT